MSEKNKMSINKMISEIGVPKLLLIAACGIVLVILPSGKSDKSQNTGTSTIQTNTYESHQMSTNDYCEEIEDKLEDILRNTAGVGDVQVMVTIKTSYEKVVLMEEKESIQTEVEGEKNITDKSYENAAVFTNGETPYVIKENEPVISGVFVVAKGGGNSETALRITNIIKSLFGVESHKIFVAGME